MQVFGKRKRRPTGRLSSTITIAKSTIPLVPSKGLEPPHRCRYMDLNHARLPIPPRWQVDFNDGSERRRIRKTCVSILQARNLVSNREPPCPECFKLLWLLQLGVHRDLRVQHLRHRASLLCRLSILLEGCRIRSRHFAHNINVARRNRPARIQFLQRERHSR